MSSTMSQSVQYIIDANAPMVFTYAHSRPEVQRIVYPTRIRGDTVSTIDAETGKYKKFKLDGIIFPQPEPSIEEYLSYAIDEGLTLSFYYRNSNPDVKRMGVPIKFSKKGKSVLIRVETYLPYRRWSNQVPTYVEHKYFKIDAMEHIQSEHYFEELPELCSPLPQQYVQSKPEWMVDREWFQEVDVEDLDEEPLEVELVDLTPYLKGDGSQCLDFSDDENDPDYEPSECETTDEEYLPSSDDDEKSTDEEVVYEEEGVRITKKMVEEERAKIHKNLERNKELKEAYNNILYNAERNRQRRECTGCKYGIMNQQAHYNGCLGDDDEY